jgi:hypothetical protein
MPSGCLILPVVQADHSLRAQLVCRMHQSSAGVIAFFRRILLWRLAFELRTIFSPPLVG